jgi:hypothetical protein
MLIVIPIHITRKSPLSGCPTVEELHVSADVKWNRGQEMEISGEIKALRADGAAVALDTLEMQRAAGLLKVRAAALITDAMRGDS